MPSDRRAVVAICHNMPFVLRDTARSFMEIGWSNRIKLACEATGFEAVDHAWYFRSPLVSCLRDLAVKDAITNKASHLIFLDADMVFPTDVLWRLLRHHDKGIVSGFYTQKGPPYAPVALRNGREQSPGVQWYEYDQGPFGRELRPQQVVGMGCTIIPMTTFDAIGPRPWFEYQNNADGWPVVSEDVPFCQRAAAAGVPIWLDPTIDCQHGQPEYKGRLHFERYQKSRAATEAHGHHDDQGDHRPVSGDLRGGHAEPPEKPDAVHVRA